MTRNLIHLNIVIFFLILSWNIKDGVSLRLSTPKLHTCLKIVNKSCVVLREFDCSDQKAIKTIKTVFKGVAFQNLGESSQILSPKLLVSNGYKDYWMYLNSTNCVKQCNVHECNIYSGYSNFENPIRIISRNEWNAQRLGRHSQFPVKPKYVIILNTVTPQCYSFDKCSERVRNIQSFHRSMWSDIGYNFLVGDDGNIYDGLGWKIRGVHTVGYNSKSIAISFIGSFSEKRPSLNAINAAKHLIHIGVKEKYIDAEYKLATPRDVKDFSEVPGIELYKIIYNWPHFFSDSNSPSQKCPIVEIDDIYATPKMAVAVSISFVSALIIGVIVSLTCVGHYKTQHKWLHKYLKEISQENRNFKIVLLSEAFEELLEGGEIIPVSSVEISIPQTKFYYIGDCKSDKCGCLSFIENVLTLYATIGQRHDLCLAVASFIQTCTSSTVVLLSSATNLFDKAFVIVVHLKESGKLQRVVKQLCTGVCVCGDRKLFIKEMCASTKSIKKNASIEKSNNLDCTRTMMDLRKRYLCVHYGSERVFYNDYLSTSV